MTQKLVVDALQELFSVIARWPGSDVEVTAISPSGKRYHRSAVPSEARHLLGPTYEIFQISDPEPGEWTVELYGADLGADGEPVTFSSNVQPRWNLPPVAKITHSLQGRVLHLDASDSHDPEGEALVEYEWLLNDADGTFATLNGPVADYVFDRAGDFGVSLRVRDASGKNGYASLTQAITVKQLYEVAGPAAPLNAEGWNTAKAGRTVPVRWRITKDGTPVDDSTSFVGLTSQLVSCESGLSEAEEVPGDTAGTSGLADHGDGSWSYTWQTERGWAGTCRQARVNFDDGSTMTFQMEFR